MRRNPKTNRKKKPENCRKGEKCNPPTDWGGRFVWLPQAAWTHETVSRCLATRQAFPNTGIAVSFLVVSPLSLKEKLSLSNITQRVFEEQRKKEKIEKKESWAKLVQRVLSWTSRDTKTQFFNNVFCIAVSHHNCDKPPPRHDDQHRCHCHRQLEQKEVLDVSSNLFGAEPADGGREFTQHQVRTPMFLTEPDWWGWMAWSQLTLFTLHTPKAKQSKAKRGHCEPLRPAL